MLSGCNFACVIFFVLLVFDQCFGIGKRMLIRPHKSPVVRGSVAQRNDGYKGYSCELPVFHLELSPYWGVANPLA